VFRSATGDRYADEVGRELVEHPEGIPMTDVNRILNRNRPAAALIDLLVRNGLARIEVEPTGGAPRKVVLPTENLISSMSYESWPTEPEPAAFYGVAGEVVEWLEPHTECDRMAILVQYLVAFGAAVGRAPYVRVGSDDHYTNEFALIIGKTSKARKGMSWGHVRRIIILATGGQP
jgi:hypothetical protein